MLPLKTIFILKTCSPHTKTFIGLRSVLFVADAAERGRGSVCNLSLSVQHLL